MSVTIAISDQIARHLSKLSLGQKNEPEEKLRLLLEAEYRRRLANYTLTDRQLTRKYQMSFEEFEQNQVTQQRHFTWEVESDAMAWETAVDGVRTAQRLLDELLSGDE